MSFLRIEEALLRAKKSGMNLKKGELAAMLWPDKLPGTQRMNMTNLLNGRAARIEPGIIPIICAACGVSADFLFGMADK